CVRHRAGRALACATVRPAPECDNNVVFTERRRSEEQLSGVVGGRRTRPPRMAPAGNVCCPPIWIGLALGVSGLRFGKDVFVLWSTPALYRICTVCDRDHVLVRRDKARHSRGLDLMVCPRLPLRT